MKPEIAFPFGSQKGSFRTEEVLDLKPKYSESKEWLKSLTSEEKTKFFMKRAEIVTFLGTKSFKDIPRLIADKDLRKTVSDEAYKRLGNMYGIEGSERQIEATINGFAKVADGAIYGLRRKDGGLLSDFADDLEMMNEVESTNNPVDLLLFSFNNNCCQRIRFEAKRKLQLMSLAGSIYQKERLANTGQKLVTFLRFLNENVWNSSGGKKIGDLEKAYILSTHSEQNGFICFETDILKDEAVRGLAMLKPNQKLTELSLREFAFGNKKILVYSSTREKSGAAKVLKLLRKGLEYPETAVDDEVGLMGVFESQKHMDFFVKKLTEAAARTDSHARCEEISDTLNGGKYEATSVGSSSEIKLRKFFLTFGVKKSEKEKEIIRVELIFFTPESYVNSLYQAEVCHREYEIRRLFDSGVAEWLFPEDIYKVKMQPTRAFLLEKARWEIEAPQRLLTYLKYA